MKIWKMTSNAIVDVLEDPDVFALADISEVSLHLSDDDYHKLKSLMHHFDYVAIWKPEGETVLFPVCDVYTHKSTMMRVYYQDAVNRGIVFKSIL